jgi:AAA15 family ATPase/GTPase
MANKNIILAEARYRENDNKSIIFFLRRSLIMYSKFGLGHTSKENAISPFHRYQIDGASPPKEMPDLSRINIFVGSNNSGKSWFMRELAKLPDYQFDLFELPIKEILDEYNSSMDELESIFASNRIINANTVHVKCDNGKYFKDYNGGIPLKQFIQSKVNEPVEYYGGSMEFSQLIQLLMHTVCPRYIDLFENPITLTNSNAESLVVFQDFLKKHESMWRKLELAMKLWRDNSLRNPPRIYIPVLRSLNYIYPEASDPLKIVDVYEKRIRSTYFKDVDDQVKISIFTGQTIYQEMHKLHTGKEVEREKKTNFELFLGKNFFNGQTVSINSVGGEDVVYVKIGDHKELPIFELGDGIQSVIIMTYPLFLFESGLFFIEEPEGHLHPGLQRKLMESLISFSKTNPNHQFFLTTHSNHFLDLTMDNNEISIYNFHREKGMFNISLVSSGSENSLRLLGVQNSSIFLANSTIWVEGYTDRLYIKKYMQEFLESSSLEDKYSICKEFKEGIHYAFVFSAGDNITHWDFTNAGEVKDFLESIGISGKSPAKLICGKALVIVDNDDEKNKIRKKELEDTLFDRFHILESTEIENLLPYEAIVQTIRQFSYWDRLEISDFPEENEINEDLFKKVKLGTLIHEHILPSVDSDKLKTLHKGRRNFVSSKELERILKNESTSFTLTGDSKRDFAQISPGFVTVGNMRSEARDLAKMIWDFVLSHNS